MTDYLRAVRSRLVVVIVMAILGASMGVYYSHSQESHYVASVQMFVSTSGNDADATQLSQGNTFALARVQSYARIVSSPVVVGPVLTSLGLDRDEAEVGREIVASSPLNTVLLNVSVTDPDAQQARHIASAIALVFPGIVAKIETPNGGGVSPVKISVTKNAGEASEVRPLGLVPSAGIGGLLAGVFGVVLAILMHRLDRRVRRDDQLVTAGASPVLGRLLQARRFKGNPLVANWATGSQPEVFRQIRTNLRFLSVDRRVTSLVVTSSLRGEGKSTVAANIAVAMAQAGEHVVLVDGDLRMPRVAEIFGLSSGVGLTSVLLGDADFASAAQQWREELPLYVLAAGPRPPNPSELLGSEALVRLLDTLTESGLLVIFDSPPLLPVTDAAVLGRLTGGAVLVVRWGRTRLEQVSAASKALELAGSSLLGVIANGVHGRQLPDYRYGQARPEAAYVDDPGAKRGDEPFREEMRGARYGSMT